MILSYYANPKTDRIFGKDNDRSYAASRERAMADFKARGGWGMITQPPLGIP